MQSQPLPRSRHEQLKLKVFAIPILIGGKFIYFLSRGIFLNYFIAFYFSADDLI